MGFKFFKEKDLKFKDKDVTVIKMKPASFIIAAIVDPLFFYFDKTEQKDSEQKKSEQSDSGKAGAPSDKGREGDKKPTDGGKNSSNEQTGSNELGNPKSPRDLTATPSLLGEKKDPFAGKGDAGGEGVNIEGLDRTAVKVPLEDQISVRALGREGKELYKNSKDAKARTALSEQELRKPEAEVGGENQRIPLEYRDLLN